ncbi:pentapeptide repeat-containing protein [Aeromicrobium ponti]|uniref:Uncharacterized protein YjbI with pentapeptide repeats n=2 Tax=Cytobacillus oceanisediminis TaxID=665099 RepID=A0A562K7J4_9BACI|nr:uncharacterized protein YjbI with pentapeptide repeats [Cytobacillus oceanisediminis]
MSNQMNHLRSDCENCFGLCCVALPFAKSADFAINKEGGIPCPNLESDNRCRIHSKLRNKGFKGCTSYECFGAGQKVSQDTFEGRDWRDHPKLAKEMFEVFPVMQQLHEMLCYLTEALRLESARPIHSELRVAQEKTDSLTNLEPHLIIGLDVSVHRAVVNDLLLKASQLVRFNSASGKINEKKKKEDFIGAKLRGSDLRRANLRGALFIAADLRKADMRYADLIGADFREADLSGANLTGSIFLTQSQVNSANGDVHTNLPESLRMPGHWVK